MGKNPNVIRMNQVGVPTYNELVVVARQNELTGGRIAVIRRFVQALGRGYASVRSNPTGAVANLVKANPTLDRKLQLASVRSTLSAFFPSGVDAGRPWGWQDPTQWTAYGQWMLSNHLVSAPTAFDGASTNEVLPGQGS
jgi:putative hydroxymethylpyrimidine transport system substrate-binding protein